MPRRGTSAAPLLADRAVRHYVCWGRGRPSDPMGTGERADTRSAPTEGRRGHKVRPYVMERQVPSPVGRGLR